MSHYSKLSTAELIGQCGSSNDPAVWKEFVNRVHRRIVLYVSRNWCLYNFPEPETDAVSDLTQEVYLYLLSNNRRALREFRGSSEPAAMSYLARIVRSIVSDHVRRRNSKKRTVTLISVDDKLSDMLEAGAESSPEKSLREQMAPQQLRSLLNSALTGNNAARDAIIFQLHVIRGLSIKEIAEIPTFSMTPANVEIVIRRTRQRLRLVLTRSETTEGLG
ncbi:MAG: sigma-70 family RNA polymerase sigma factor [Acidobacteriota bacterium]